MLRTHTCGELRAADAGREVTLAGWVHRRRDHGDVTFIDLRDRYGLTQVVAKASDDAAAHEALGRARSEWVLRVRGKVRPRPEGTRNADLATGEIEVVAGAVEVLNESKTPPFYVNEETPVDETLRWKYRYVDLRRERSRELIRLRHEVTNFIRSFFVERGFWEVETTMMIRSDPTGARDFVVPSRYYPGKFWALPQSPQQLKQILMVGGIDRYVQIARCFRDEDPRSDRVYELTQLDVEMSFPEPNDVMAIVEECYTRLFEKFARKPLAAVPWPRLTYEEAIRRFGTDRPDTRFGMELVDLTDAVRGTAFNAYRGAVEAGGVVRGMVVPGKADASRKEVDGWTAVAKTGGAKGLATFAYAGGEVRSPVAKFLSADELTALRAASGARDGDLLVTVADAYKVASESLGVLRRHLGAALGLADGSKHHALWVVEFPLLERTPEGGWTFSHNPFCAPYSDEDLALLDTDPGKAKSKQYDLVVDGNELGGGSVRIHRRAVQEKVFELMGTSKAEAAARFSGFLDALEHGAPPHGGIATGMDRTVMILAGTENVREVIAFPKTQTGFDPLLDAPAPLDEGLLGELGLAVLPRKDERPRG
ncbi:MAG TPA: aspartate--tRNA ligase [Candidatus Limnocylindria bacterium]|nr:aspartate--tRNA ligase [Candidatus Limnocylindria bacterium]